ncbi:type II toxin-antitoxin system RelE/ParE family toxin [Jiella endophytica]|uniref:Type II toxin-antitoxin system RelE/ParE family toxin n=1 Tax=Jiella endophytica TaxID=2558362 RepID=A0A4Y8RSY9_9HYPH|nr:type II toxin-antitoxin system RelE/ParE family toxin [Jiella endophytica]TFF27429.1 type II toxin-antitoxin system RelE/ParE family toxin [Jiella endophytica]
MHLRISEDAEADLRFLRDYLNPRSPQAYQRILIAIFAAFDQLEVFPLLGREGEVAGTRELTVPRTPYRIVYSLPNAYFLDVERVLHGSLRYPSDED